MIEYIKGNLADLTPTYAVIEAAGVGYAIHIALPSYSAMVGKENTDTKLYVTEIIREDMHDLYGFFTRGERELFVMLMTVSGIGANTARMIMSAYTASEIRQIIATGNARALSQVKGLGPKTAQRIIVDLKDKVGSVMHNAQCTMHNGLSIASTETQEEAVAALVALGFQRAASVKVVEKLLKEDATMAVAKIIKRALAMI